MPLLLLELIAAAVADEPPNWTTGISWERRIRFELCIFTATETDDRSPGKGVSTVNRVMINEHNLGEGGIEEKNNYYYNIAEMHFCFRIFGISACVVILLYPESQLAFFDISTGYSYL